MKGRSGPQGENTGEGNFQSVTTDQLSVGSDGPATSFDDIGGGGYWTPIDTAADGDDTTVFDETFTPSTTYDMYLLRAYVVNEDDQNATLELRLEGSTYSSSHYKVQGDPTGNWDNNAGESEIELVGMGNEGGAPAVANVVILKPDTIGGTSFSGEILVGGVSPAQSQASLFGVTGGVNAEHSGHVSEIKLFCIHAGTDASIGTVELLGRNLPD